MHKWTRGQAILEYMLIFGVIAAITVLGATTANKFISGGKGLKTSMDNLFDKAVNAIKP